MILLLVEVFTWPAVLIVLGPAVLATWLFGSRKPKGKGKK